MSIYSHIPYTYRIKWSHSQMNYYGVRYAKNCCPSDLFVTYFTSSEYVAQYIKENGLPDIIEIRKIFNDPNKVNSAREWESRVLKKMNVINREDYLNKSDNKGIDPKLSSAARKGISPGNKGKPQEEYIKAKKRKPKPIVQCPHCGIFGGKSAMYRHHFNNCGKNIPSITLNKIASGNMKKASRDIVLKIKNLCNPITDKKMRQIRKTLNMKRGWYQLSDEELNRLYLTLLGLLVSFFPKQLK